MIRAFFFASLLVGATALASESATAASGSPAVTKRQLTLLFTGDNGGEVAPCG